MYAIKQTKKTYWVIQERDYRIKGDSVTVIVTEYPDKETAKENNRKNKLNERSFTVTIEGNEKIKDTDYASIIAEQIENGEALLIE